MIFTDLRNSIYNALSEISGSNGTYYTLATQGEDVYPYAVFYVISNTEADMNFNTERERYEIQVNLFDKNESINIIETMLEDCVTKIENISGSISITGYNYFQLRKNFIIPIRKINDVWQTSLSYTLEIIK